MIVGMALMK